MSAAGCGQTTSGKQSARGRNTPVRQTHLIPSLLIALTFFPATLHAQSPTQLPVTSVALYKNGVGFFEHSGRVNGNQSVTVDFTTAQLNDVLQSLTAIDLNGGRIAGASYNSTTPLEQQLKALPLALGQNPSTLDFYNAIRGARVEVNGPGTKVGGRLMNIELVETPASGNQPAAEKRMITVVGEGGEVRTVELTAATEVLLLDADLHRDVTRYLELLAGTRGNTQGQGLRHLSLQDNGTGARQLCVSYISEVPIWKSTYRILFTEPKTADASTKQTATLQGWSVVDNTTGADWINVHLSLIAGAPQSFIQPLSVPLYSHRPMIGLPQEAQLAPQTHESGEMLQQTKARNGSRNGGGIQGTVTDPSGAAIPRAQVIATNTDTGVATTRITGAGGNYSIQPLPAGTYNVEVVSRGFQRLLQENVTVDNASVVGLPLKLNVGAASDTVTITDAPPYLNTTDATLGGTIENELYSQLPLSMNGGPRDPTAFQYLMPGVQENPANAKAQGTTAGSSGVYGGTGQTNLNANYVEGVPVSNIAVQGSGQAVANAVSVDAISTGANASGLALMKRLPTLPSKLPELSVVESAGHTLAIDTAGALFRSDDAGVTWHPVAAQWQGRALSLRLAQPRPIAQPAATTKTAADAKLQAQPVGTLSPSFELTTDSGAIYTSSDGQSWQRR
jgi:hypothetical protein